jgi:signal transduction histidine kinase/ligand-binding sensor domain-containing protein
VSSFRAWLLFLTGLVGGCFPAAGLDPSALFSQYIHRVWGLAEGLASNYPLAVTQSQDGLLWVAAESGLTRLDGRSARVFGARSHPAIIKANSFFTIAPDRQGNLWAGLNRGGGLIRIGGVPNLRLGKADGLLHGSIIQLAPSSSGGVWAATLGGLHEISPEGRIRADLTGQVITAVLEDRRGLVWAATAAGLRVRDRDSWVALPGDPGGRVFKMVEDSAGRIWFGGTRGLWFWSESKFNPVGQSVIRGDAVLSLAVDPDAGVWVGTSQGRIYRWTTGGLQPVPFDGEASINDLYFDREGSLWISTQGLGLHQITDSPVAMFGSPEGLVGDAVRTLFEDSQGRVWAATSRGVCVRSPESRRFDRVPELPAGSFILAEDPSTTSLVVASLTGGIGFWRPGTALRWRLNLNEEPVLSLTINAPGEGYAGTDRSLYRFSGESVAKIPNVAGPVRHLAAEPRPGPPALWAAAANGLWRIAGGSPEAVRPGRTTALWISPDGTVWSGTGDGGAHWWQRGTTGTLDLALLPSDLVTTLVGSPGVLFAGTGRGIARIPIPADPRNITGPARIYGASDGMRSPEITGEHQASASELRGGRVAFATPKGIAELHLRHSGSTRAVPAMRMLEARADGQELPLRGGLQVPAGTRNLELQLATASFLSSESNRVEYRLVGRDPQWRQAQGPVVEVNSPGPGRFSLEARVTTPDGAQATMTPVPVEVAALWYQQWWMPLAELSAVLLSAYGLFRLRLAQIRQRFQLALDERSRIAREIHDTLLQRITAVNMQLEVASLLGGGSEPDPAARHIRIAHQAAKEGIAEARRSIAGWRSEWLEYPDFAQAVTAMVDSLVAGVSLHAEVRCSAQARGLRPEGRQEVLRIIQEAVVNAVKHAQAVHVWVEVREDGKWLHATVRDDGVGFPADSVTTGFGMSGMRSRAMGLGATLQVRAHPDGGTVVELQVKQRRALWKLSWRHA